MSSERRIEPLEDAGAARILPLAEVTRLIGRWPPEFRALRGNGAAGHARPQSEIRCRAYFISRVSMWIGGGTMSLEHLPVRQGGAYTISMVQLARLSWTELKHRGRSI